MGDSEKKDEGRLELIRSKMSNLQDIEMGVNIAHSILSRYNDTKDPIIRYTLFLDKFMLILDALSGVVMSDFIFRQFDLERKDSDITHLKEYSELKVKQGGIQDKIVAVVSKLRIEMNKLSDYIQKDLYSPDHRPGSELMKEAKIHFEGKSS